jgi:hypothetical protein
MCAMPLLVHRTVKCQLPWGADRRADHDQPTWPCLFARRNGIDCRDVRGARTSSPHALPGTPVAVILKT